MLAFLASTKPDGSSPAVSIRWAIAAKVDWRLQLELPSLPTQAKNLTRGCLKGDNSVATLLAAIKLKADMFDGENIGRPVPLIYPRTGGTAH
jgi:hypothetical protein